MTENFPLYSDQAIASHCRPSILSTTTEIASNFQLPFDMALNSVLSAVATVCQGKIDVSYPDGATMPVSLNTITVAEPGAGKTPCQRQAFRAIRECQAARKIRRNQNL